MADAPGVPGGVAQRDLAFEISAPALDERALAPWAPQVLHPALWRANQLGHAHSDGLPSGFDALDAVLPGGGWPARVLTELLLPHPGLGELRLLAPVLGAVQRSGRSVMWFDPPAAPCAWALAALGVDTRQLVVVRSRLGWVGARGRARGPAADLPWALEQALKSGHVGALVAWLPVRLAADALRRLQLAAQAHDGPVFLLRGAAECVKPSAAPLRLGLASAGPDSLRVTLLKRRGPALGQALTLALAPVLSATALGRALAARAPQGLRVPGPQGPALSVGATA